ncbi:hypothetical protein Mapa_001757 [Marchantia paleacea]|nr:hypothetical protein Mapa_001757 [Marchantia paleacea]
MARSIAGTAVWCCPSKIAPQLTLSLPSCRYPESVSSQLSLGSKQALIFVGHLRPAALLPGPSVDPPKIRLLHIVECQQRHEKEGLVGTRSETGIIQSRKNKSGDGTNFLAVTEGVCILVAGASYTASAIQKSQQTATVASSPAVHHFFSKFGDLSSWQVPALWAALVINALLRSMQMRSSLDRTQIKWEEKSIKDFTVDQRIGKLEDDVHSVAAIARMLSRHLEKLGVRFRVTRRTLRDPIQETAMLALKTSEVVSALATREDMLEAELRETRKELRETQEILVSMQASQEKQLELLVTAMTQTVKSQKALEGKFSRESTRRLAGTTNKLTSTDIGAPVAKRKSIAPEESRKSNFAEKLGGLRKSFMKQTETPTKTRLSGAQAVDAEKAELKKEIIGDSKNRHVEGPPLEQKPAKKNAAFKPDTSFTKEDFWANTPSTSAADLTVEHEVVDYITSTERTTDALSRYSDGPQTSGRLDSFSSGRNNINGFQGPINLSTQDYHNPGISSIHPRSGDYSIGSVRHRDMGFGFNVDIGVGKDKWSSSETSHEVGLGGSLHGDVNSWSNLSAGDASSGSGSASGSPRHSNWSSTSAWDVTSGSGSPRHNSWSNSSALDCSSGAGSPRMGEGIINFVQAGFVDTDFMRDFKDGYVSS